MPTMFNTLLREAGLSLTEVRLLRHKDKSAKKGYTPYDLWYLRPRQFELYQSHQTHRDGARLKGSYWASFLGRIPGETMFIGIYAVHYLGPLKRDTPMPHRDRLDTAGSCGDYALTLEPALNDLIGRLFIDWGRSPRTWIQRPDRQDKPITKVLPHRAPYAPV
jgi:hypothetical protein